MATCLSWRVSAICAFCWPTTQTPLHNQLPSRCRSHKASYSNFSSKIGCKGNTLSTCSSPYDFLGPFEPATQTASRSVQPFMQGSLVWQTDRQTDRHTKPVNCNFSPKNWLPWQRPLVTRSRLCLHRIAWPRKRTHRIKQRVASYHTTKVITGSEIL